MGNKKQSAPRKDPLARSTRGANGARMKPLPAASAQRAHGDKGSCDKGGYDSVFRHHPPTARRHSWGAPLSQRPAAAARDHVRPPAAKTAGPTVRGAQPDHRAQGNRRRGPPNVLLRVHGDDAGHRVKATPQGQEARQQGRHGQPPRPIPARSHGSSRDRPEAGGGERNAEMATQPQESVCNGRGWGGGGKQTGRTRGRTGEGGGCGRKKRDAVRKTQKRCWPRNERVAAGGSGTKPSDGRAAAWGALLCVWTIATARVLSRLKTVGAHPHERGRARRGGRTVAAAAALPAGSRRPGLAADRPRLCPPRRAHARR